MNLSHRTKFSLCQFLDLMNLKQAENLLLKYIPQKVDIYFLEENRSDRTREIILKGSSDQLGALLDEIARTQTAIKQGIESKTAFKERWEDLRLCLELDNYRFDEVNFFSAKLNIKLKVFNQWRTIFYLSYKNRFFRMQMQSLRKYKIQPMLT